MKLMHKSILILPLFCVFATLSHAQREADIWVIGTDHQDDPYDTIRGTTIMDFSTEPPTMWYEPSLTMDNYVTNAAIADADGQYLFSTNGMQIFDFQNRPIADTIAYISDGLYWRSYSEPPDFVSGFYLDQGALILPVPDSADLYSVLYHYMENDKEVGYFQPNYLLEARVRMDREIESELIYKDSIIISDYFFGFGKFTACRHANGRDWWIVIPEKEGQAFKMFLLSPEGIHLHHEDDTEISVDDGAGTSWFSEDGNWYAKVDIRKFDDGIYIIVYNFDRCSGTLYKHTELHISGDWLSGAVFSPSSRFLYATSPRDKLYQWDLQAQDVQGSRILIDTFDGFEYDGNPTNFSKMMPSPNGKPYIIPTTISSKFMHVVNRPNEKGKACNFIQRQIELPTKNYRSIPNYANYRLGPIDGSPCDTLGIDNIPVAKWRYELESPDNELRIRFTDRSYFNPEEWYWDFDDGSHSILPHPKHTYATPGTYHVCLTVSNENASDSSCQTINVTTTSVDGPNSLDAVRIFPNPVTDYLEIRLPHQETFTIQLSTVEGRTLFSPTMTCPCRINLSSLSPGVYILNLLQDGEVVRTEKVVKGE